MSLMLRSSGKALTYPSYRVVQQYARPGMQYGQTADTPTRIAWIAFLLFTPMLRVAVPISLGEF